MVNDILQVYKLVRRRQMNVTRLTRNHIIYIWNIYNWRGRTSSIYMFVKGMCVEVSCRPTLYVSMYLGVATGKEEVKTLL